MERSSTFRDPEHQRRFERDGYVRLPFLEDAEVAALLEAYQQLAPASASELAIDYGHPDRSVMRAVADLVAPLLDRHLPELFVDHRSVFATFVTKHPGEGSAMALHEDRTWIDDAVHRSGTIWVPLVDTGPARCNGALEVVAGSEVLTPGRSGTRTPQLFRPYEAWLRQHLEPVEVRAGEALFYDSRMLHASGPNRSETARTALVCAIVPRTAAPVHVVATGRRHRRVHRVDEAFFCDVHPEDVAASIDPASHPVISEYDDRHRLTPEDLVAALGPPPGSHEAPRTEAERAAEEAGLRPQTRRMPLCEEDSAVRCTPSAAASIERRAHVEVVEGAGAVLDVSQDGAEVPTWLRLAEQVIARSQHAVALVLEPGGRAAIRLEDPGAPGAAWALDVVDVAPASALLLTDGASIPLDEMVRLTVPPGPMTIEHGGPGQLVAVLAAGERRPWRRALARRRRSARRERSGTVR